MLRHLLITSAVVSLAVMPGFAQEAGVLPPEPAGQSGLPASSPAADQPAPEPETDAAATATPVPPPPSDAIVAAEAATDMRAEKLIGTAVYNLKGEEVGSVEDIVFDKDGQIVGFVLSVGGGLFGIGGKSVGIAWEEVNLSPGPEVLVSYSEEQLENAPDFKAQEAIASEAEAERWRQEQLQNQPPMPQ